MNGEVASNFGILVAKRDTMVGVHPYRPSNCIRGSERGIGAATVGVPSGVHVSQLLGLMPEKTRLGSEMDGVGMTKGDGRGISADLVENGLAGSSRFSSLMTMGTFEIGVVMLGRISDIFASSSGRKREPPPRRFEIRLKNWLRYSDGPTSKMPLSKGTQAMTSVTVQATSKIFSIRPIPCTSIARCGRTLTSAIKSFAMSMGYLKVIEELDDVEER